MKEVSVKMYKIIPQTIPDCLEIIPDIFRDERGETERLDFDNPEWFARAAEFASNTEVYPLAKNRIRLTFTFHGITTPLV